MVVQEVHNLDDFLKKSGGKLVVIDFFAVWCGPCQAMAPKIEAMSNKYQDVNFGKIDIEKNRSDASRYGITGVPTFILFIDGRSVATVNGANEAALDENIAKFRQQCKPTFSGTAHVMSTNHDSDLSQDEIRRRRLEKLQSAAATDKVEETSHVPAPPEILSTPEILNTNNNIPQNDSINTIKMEEEEKTNTTEDNTHTSINPPILTLEGDTNPVIDQLRVMGFEDYKILYLKSRNLLVDVESAINYLSEHAEIPDITGQAMLELPGYVLENGVYRQLSLEEREQKMKELIEKKKLENESAAKVHEKQSEIERRKMGQNILQTKEEVEKLRIQREADQRNQAKLAEAEEKKKILEKWQKDHPNTSIKEKAEDPISKIAAIVNGISCLRLNDEGKTALKTISIYLKNSTDPNKRKINMENQAFVNRVKNIYGAIDLLQIGGYRQDGNFLIMDEYKDAVINEIISEINKNI